jgi:hypothetical protein
MAARIDLCGKNTQLTASQFIARKAAAARVSRCAEMATFRSPVEGFAFSTKGLKKPR